MLCKLILIFLLTIRAGGIASAEESAASGPFFEEGETRSELLGWSRDGNRLAVLDFESGGPASNVAELRVVDLRTDRQVAGQRWQWEGRERGALAKVRARARALAEGQGCRVPGDGGLRKFQKETPFQVEVVFVARQSVRVLLRQGGQSKKIYGQMLVGESEFDQSVSYEVTGFLEGPNPNRIAVVIERVARGPDGEASRECLIVGAGVKRLF